MDGDAYPQPIYLFIYLDLVHDIMTRSKKNQKKEKTNLHRFLLRCSPIILSINPPREVVRCHRSRHRQCKTKKAEATACETRREGTQGGRGYISLSSYRKLNK